MCVQYELEQVHRFPSSFYFAPRTALETLTGYGWFVSVGNVQSRPKGDFKSGNSFRESAEVTHILPRVHFVRVYCVDHIYSG